MTYCPRCGSVSNEIVLLGMRDYIDRCDACNLEIVGGGPCPKCKKPTRRLRTLGEEERLPASTTCASCNDEIARFNKIVAEGGVLFRCTGCGADGVIEGRSPVARHTREQTGIRAPDPVGVEFETCPRCEKPGNA